MKNTLFDFSGKRILLCGAQTETGQAIASGLHRAGAELVLADKIAEVSETTDTEWLKSVGLGWQIDDLESIEERVKTEVKNNGAFDGFVYASGMGGVRPLKLTKTGFVQEMMSANFFAFLEWVRCLNLRGNFNNGGSIVAISSVSAVRGLKSKIAYSASKAALDASIRCIASELADKRIRVNSILKGWVTADMKSEFIRNNMSLSESEDLAKQVLGVTEPEEIAHTVAFLLSDATPTITGTSLVLDGGYTL